MYVCGLLLVAFHLHACGVYVFLFMLYVSITIGFDKGYTLRLMSLLCSCFFIDHLFFSSQIFGSNSGLFLCGRHILFLSLGHLRGTFLHCFGTKINRVVTSKFDYWVCVFFFVYSWWVLIKYQWYIRWTTSQLQYKSMNPEFTKITAWRWSQQSRHIHVTYIIISQINARVVLANKHTFYYLLFFINFGTNRTSSRHGAVTFPLSNSLI